MFSLSFFFTVGGVGEGALPLPSTSCAPKDTFLHRARSARLRSVSAILIIAFDADSRYLEKLTMRQPHARCLSKRSNRQPSWWAAPGFPDLRPRVSDGLNEFQWQIGAPGDGFRRHINHAVSSAGSENC